MTGVFKDGAYYPLGLGGEMSEAEYEYQYQLCNDGPDDDREPPPPLEMPIGFWSTRNRVALEIKNMTTQHLVNAVALFERSGWGKSEKIRELRSELNQRAAKLKNR